jgi:hypothetical protein
MMIAAACEALRAGRVLQLRYDGYTREVEVHAVGYSEAGNAIMRVWQLRGGSQSGDRTGWKLLRLDETAGYGITDEKSQAPRGGYRRQDRAMASISCQV